MFRSGQSTSVTFDPPAGRALTIAHPSRKGVANDHLSTMAYIGTSDPAAGGVRYLRVP
jgi:hypothetical protein